MTEEEQLAEAKRIQGEIRDLANSHPQISFSNYKTAIPRLVRQVAQIALDAAQLQQADSELELKQAEKLKALEDAASDVVQEGDE
jgi:uncharacterized protein (UPF0147 family)